MVLTKNLIAVPRTNHPRDSRSPQKYTVQVCLFWIPHVCRIKGSFPRTCRPISFQIMLSSQSWTGHEGPEYTLILGAFNSLLHNSWRGKLEDQLTAVSEERDGRMGEIKKNLAATLIAVDIQMSLSVTQKDAIFLAWEVIPWLES